jgi:hypothetical protein
MSMMPGFPQQMPGMQQMAAQPQMPMQSVPQAGGQLPQQGMQPGVPGQQPLQQQAQKAPQVLNVEGSVQPGMLIWFPYTQAKNDMSPLIVVAKAERGHLLKGVNLHYLTFPYIRRVLLGSGGNPSFSYYNIRSDRYIVNAYRSYTWSAVLWNRAKIFDSKFIIQTISTMKTMDPLQLRAIRMDIESQLNGAVPQQQAGATAPMPMGSQPSVPTTGTLSPQAPMTGSQ